MSFRHKSLKEALENTTVEDLTSEWYSLSDSEMKRPKIEIAGRLFSSIKEAAQQSGFGIGQLRGWLRSKNPTKRIQHKIRRVYED